jgi:UDP-N-acetylmuramyl pentapeptide phosphotransferase/UDP-N-acetylglucosamine-1-phosphate transferase
MLIEFASATVIALVASCAFAPLVINAGLMDEPNRPRKIQPTATPTGGGLAIGFGVAVALSALALWPNSAWQTALDETQLRQLAMTVAFSFGALLLGLWDDYRTLTARAKMALMALLCLGVVIWVARAETLPIVAGQGWRVPGTLAILGSALWVFVLMNGTNFMDGANGLAMGCTAISLAGLAALGAISNAPVTTALGLAGAGALVGFLVWNWPSGKLFAGDAGALFAGLYAATVALIAIGEAGLSPFLVAVLFFPVLADVILTFIWRASQRRNLLDGHSDHFYQIAASAGFDRNQITLLYWLSTLSCVAAGIMAVVLWRAVFVTVEPGEHGPIVDGFVTLASMSGKILLTIFGIISIVLSVVIRRFVASRGIQ